MNTIICRTTNRIMFVRDKHTPFMTYDLWGKNNYFYTVILSTPKEFIPEQCYLWKKTDIFEYDDSILNNKEELQKIITDRLRGDLLQLLRKQIEIKQNEYSYGLPLQSLIYNNFKLWNELGYANNTSPLLAESQFNAMALKMQYDLNHYEISRLSFIDKILNSNQPELEKLRTEIVQL